MAGVHVVELEQLDVYKVVGEETSVLDYVDGHAPVSLTDWSGVYFQFSEPHAAGTVGYRWDQGYDRARMYQLRLCDIRVLVMEGTIWCDGSVPGGDKAALARSMIADACGVEVHPEMPLVVALGEHGLCLAMRETVDEWELVIAPSLVRSSLEDEGLVKEYKAKYGATSHYRVGDDSAWTAFDDAAHLAEPTPAPAWLQQVN